VYQILMTNLLTTLSPLLRTKRWQFEPYLNYNNNKPVLSTQIRKRTPNQKSNCKKCNKIIQRFKLRRKGKGKVLKEFFYASTAGGKRTHDLMTSRLTAPSSTSSQSSMMHRHRNSPLYIQYHHMVRNNLIIIFLMERMVG